MIIVLDTNVVVSGILTPGGPAGRVVDLWADGAFTVAVSPVLIEEYIGVLLRPKSRVLGPAGKRTRLVASFLDLANTVTVLPQTPLNVVADDPADNRVLECAAAAKAAYVVSGDRHLLQLGMFGATPVLSPDGFLEKIPLCGGSNRHNF